MVEEKVFADSIKKCYTYDSVGRVIETVVKNISDDSAIEKETFAYDAAGNITDAPDSCFQYDTNNRLVVFNGNAVSYDLDGNMLSDGVRCFTYDSTNKLITADGHTYTYNAEGVRIRNLCECGEETTYTYNTNCKLSRILMKTTDGVVTKYVYGKGLIGEEVNNTFKTYHFDFRGSTIAITDASGAITDTFAYDTYGKCISRTGTSDVIFGYNGRDGVVTDGNGLIYMRARYYSPEMKRFINADIVAGSITNAVTLNRFAYANGNPISFVDPFGLSAWDWIKEKSNKYVIEPVKKYIVEPIEEKVIEPTVSFINEEVVQPICDAYDYLKTNITDFATKFAEDIENYDEYNTDVEKVYDSHYFSSYKETFVIRFSSTWLSSWAIGNMIFLNHADDPLSEQPISSIHVDTLNHEYGHTRQCEEMGLVGFFFFVAIPSVFYNLKSRGDQELLDNYYNMPWEYDADLRGGVERKGTASWALSARYKYFCLWDPEFRERLYRVIKNLKPIIV